MFEEIPILINDLHLFENHRESYVWTGNYHRWLLLLISLDFCLFTLPTRKTNVKSFLDGYVKLKMYFSRIGKYNKGILHKINGLELRSAGRFHCQGNMRLQK